jgi:hypothetical protein
LLLGHEHGLCDSEQSGVFAILLGCPLGTPGKAAQIIGRPSSGSVNDSLNLPLVDCLSPMYVVSILFIAGPSLKRLSQYNIYFSRFINEEVFGFL